MCVLGGKINSSSGRKSNFQRDSWADEMTDGVIVCDGGTIKFVMTIKQKKIFCVLCRKTGCVVGFRTGNFVTAYLMLTAVPNIILGICSAHPGTVCCTPYMLLCGMNLRSEALVYLEHGVCC